MEIKSILLDTNAYVAFKRGESSAVELLQRVDTILVCPIVLGELKAGFALGNQTKNNEKGLARFIASKRVFMVDVTEHMGEYYASIFAELRQKGKPIPTNDLWIASIAKQFNLSVFTYDKHFNEISGLHLVSKSADLVG